MTYLCFDLGLNNTGIAWADSTKLAQPLKTLYHKNTKTLLLQTKKIIEEHNPDFIILGKPSKGAIKDLSEKFKKNLNNFFSGKIYFQNEDFSSQQAQEKTIQTGKSYSKRRQIHHSAAAAIILQEFLDQY